VRLGDALRYVIALDAAPIAVVRDGGKIPAMRFSAFHSEQMVNERAVVTVWIRADEGLDDADFTQFRETCAAAETPSKIRDSVIEVSAPVAKGTLHLSADVKAEKRLLIEGADKQFETGIISINGHDFGGPCLR
jgi:hypothetical protein